MILVALMFVFGAWNVQQLAQLPSANWLICALLVVVAILATQTYTRYSVVLSTPKYFKSALFGVVAFLVGVIWASSFAYWRLSDELPHAWEQKTIAIQGVVASVPEMTERGERFRFDVEKVLTKGAIVPKRISLNLYHLSTDDESNSSIANAANSTPFKAGERWLLSVRLKRPHSTINPHGFDFESWALAENIRATGSVKVKAGFKKVDEFVFRPTYIVEHLRERVQQRIVQVLAGKPYSGIIQALVMGDDSQIGTADWQVFLRTGTSHLMSISGLHITMIAGLAYGFVSFFWRRSPKLVMQLPTRKAATIAGVIVAMLYALIAGFSVPSQRTFYMLLVFALALWSGRRLAVSHVLSIALLVVVLIDPWAVSAHGFWLSFGAVALMTYVLGCRIGQMYWLQSVIKTQYAVTIGMLPLLLVMFGQTSVISPVANAFAIPLISFVVTPLALLGSFLPSNVLTDAPLLLSYQALEICMATLNWLNQMPLATWQQHEPAIWTFIPAMLGVLWILLPRGIPMRYFGLIGLLPMLLIVPARPAIGDMKVSVLDVGQGLSVVVQTAKHHLVYDAGPKYNEQSDAGSRIVVPFLQGEGVKKVDGLIVSHNDIDHSGGMNSVLALMPVSWLASSLPEEVEVTAGLKKLTCFAGQHWIWDDVRFEILYPTMKSYNDKKLKDNHRSCVLKVSSQSGSLLLTGDIEKSDELELLELDASGLKSDVMVVPHHGSKTSSTEVFMAAVSPRVSIFTNGYLNRFGHPSPSVLARYQAKTISLYRSDYNGAVVLDYVNPKNIQILSWRSQYKRYWQDVF